jgi:integrase
MLKKSRNFDLKAAMQQVVEVRPEVAELTFNELAKAWLASRPNDARAHSRIGKWQKTFGDVRAWDLDTESLTTAVSALHAAGYAPGTVNRDISIVGSVYKWAESKGICPKHFKSPTLGISRSKEEPRVVAITDEERKRILALAKAKRDKRFCVFVHLIADTGARKSEVLERTWADVDLDKREIMLKTSKTGKPRILFFSQATADMIRKVIPNRPADALLFPGRVPTIPRAYYKPWIQLTEAAGCPDLHLHDLRHDKARRLLLAGTPPAIAAAIMGHSVQMLLNRYAHLVVDDHRAAVEKLFGMAA